MKRTALIVDDESKSRKSLRQKLEDYCHDIEIIGEAVNGFEGLEKIKKDSPDIIFLDIEMPALNGLQLAEQLGHYSGAIIFTTAYNEYAIKAFKYSAFDYLLKPVDITELQECLARLLQVQKDPSTQMNNQKQMELLLGHLQGNPGINRKIAISTQEAVHFFDLGDIVRLEAHSNYTQLYFSNGNKLLTSKTLGEFEALLPGDFFFRIHHSYLINMMHVRKYLKADGGQIEMSDGALVDISRRKKEDFLALIKNL